MKYLIWLSFLFFFVFGMEFSVSAQQQVVPWTQSLPVDDQDTLQVYVDPASVKIVPTDKKQVYVTGSGISNEDLSRIKWETKNKIIKLDYRGDKSLKNVQFEIQVPASMNLDFYVSGDVESTSGIGGNVKITTDSGDIDLTDVNGSLNASTNSGEIYLKNIQGNGILTAKDGDIDLEIVSGDLDLNNQDGDSYAKQVTGNLNARSTDGDITVGETKGNASITTEIGDVMIRKASGLTTVDTTDGDIDLSEADNSIVLSSSGGDISLKKITGPFEIKTNSGEIDAEVIPGRTGKGKIVSKDGDLLLYIPETAAVTITANVRETTESEAEEESDAIESDFKPNRSDRSGQEIRNEYVLNGGGDTILLETVKGSIQIGKLAPQN